MANIHRNATSWIAELFPKKSDLRHLADHAKHLLIVTDSELDRPGVKDHAVSLAWTWSLVNLRELLTSKESNRFGL